MLVLAGSPGGGGGLGVFPTLPDSAPGYAYPVVGATLVILGLIYLAAKRLPTKTGSDPTPAAPGAPAAPNAASATSPPTGRDDSRDDEVETSYDVLHDVIARLSRTQTELAGCRAHAERTEQRSRRLYDALTRAQNDLRAARRELDRYEVAARPLHADRGPSRPGGSLAPVPQPDPSPLPPCVDDPTDPIPGPGLP